MANFCPNQHENVEGAFFCEVCGAELNGVSQHALEVRLCPRCGTPNAPEARDCVQCGLELSSLQPLQPLEPALVVLADGVRFPLVGQEEFTVGRADPVSNSYPDIDLTTHGGEDGGVSRVHLRIRLANGHYTIEDQKSSNLTFLNKQRLDAFVVVAIKHGDELRLGRVLLRFELP